jgi:DNA-binding CsgD family transcriptional regulator/tetratricopeptide (TPR) repeat protein
MTTTADSWLPGRRHECGRLDGLLAGARTGHSAALVIQGEAGVGKTALLDYVAESAADLRVLRAAGVESEMELAFATLHQMCGPVLDRLDRLPEPQRAALGTAFSLQEGPPPDRFLIGLAVLSLLAEVAEDGPVVCVIDDARWLDRASARILAFVARRLIAESVLMIFAVREPDADLDGLPELLVQGLREDHAQQLLRSVVPWPLDRRVAEQIVAETRGNPLALLELPRGLSPAQLAGGFGLLETPLEVLSLTGRIEDSFLRRVEALPSPARLWLVVAAAEPTGDLALVWRAQAQLGIPEVAAESAVADGLVEVGARVRFRHPLVRSAVYRSASGSERQAAHRALAQATDPQLDPDRRAWHRAQAASEADEDLAAELMLSAGRAQARGGLTAAAAFLERAASLSPDPGRRVGRTLAAAQAKAQAGLPDAALGLLAQAEAGPADELLRARIGLLRGQMAFASSHGADASRLLLHTARQLEPLDVRLARETYLDALAAAIFVGRLAGVVGLPEVARAALSAPPAPPPSRAPDLLLDGLATLITHRYEAGTSAVRSAVAAFRHRDLTVEDELRWFFVACHAAHDVWDDDGWYALSARHLQLARDVGALNVLPLALAQRVGAHLHAGEFRAAALLVEETAAITEATRNDLPPYSALALAGWQGHAVEAADLINLAVNGLTVRGEGMGLGLVRHTSAVLSNGLGRYRDAMTAADEASAYPQELGFANWGLVELVEAAIRCGETARAADAVGRLTRTTRPSGTPWALGIEARSRALVSEGEAAERLYREAIGQLGQCRGAVALARAHLIYGEWLRREHRRTDARGQLRTAYDMFAGMGAEAFAERARRELLATGETVRKRTADVPETLTPQERLIAGRARDGQPNTEIAAELFLSTRTVEWHLRKVFTKLGISSRRQLRQALLEEEHSALEPDAGLP